MKHITNKYAVQALAMGTFLGAMLVAGPVLADATPATETMVHHHKHHAKANSPERVEDRIAYLHGALKITPDQEDRWTKVAGVMQENAAKMNELAKDRAQNAATMTAVDDLKSYANIAEEHAEGAKKLTKTFEPLYDSMSDDQKKLADAEFHGHGHHGSMHHTG